MKYKAIIFDMDGTITDSEHIWKSATKELLTSRGVEVTQELHDELEKQLKGSAIHNTCALLKERFNLEHALEELMEEKKRRASVLLQEGLKFIDGFEKFHRTVLENEVMVGIATNADDNTLQLSDKALDLKKYFGKHIYNITYVNNKAKPDPDLYLHVAQQLGVEPEYCIAFEDSAHGVRAAKRAGMFCVGINTAGDRDALHESDLVIDHYDEIQFERLLRRKGIKKIS
ncbi:MAG: HAD superfamily hydrolase (TIGR01509 family) [Alteromonas naphthalenivorans]|jgi:HAD superfamily hydrolase (TIGR01509 family)